MPDINHSQITCCAMDAQESKRELSRLEASVIGQYLLDRGESDDMLWHDIYYRPRSVSERVSAGIAEHYSDARWDERIAWDMLGTYCLNTPDYGTA